MNESDVIAALARSRYSAPEWALVPQVTLWCQETGRDRRADLYAVGLWPSTKHRVEGFEIKTDRGDWLREVARPAKSAVHRAHVDAWWIVAPTGVVKLGEIPAGWGYYEVRGRALSKVYRAVKPTEPTGRDPRLSRALVAKLLQRVIFQAQSIGQRAAEDHVREMLERRRIAAERAARRAADHAVWTGGAS